MDSEKLGLDHACAPSGQALSGSSLSGTNLSIPNSSNGSGRVALLGLCALP